MAFKLNILHRGHVYMRQPANKERVENAVVRHEEHQENIQLAQENEVLHRKQQELKRRQAQHG